MDCALKLLNSQVNRRMSPEQQCSLERGAVLPCSDGLLLQDLRPVDALALMLGGAKGSSTATMPLVETWVNERKPEINVSLDVRSKSKEGDSANEVARSEASWAPSWPKTALRGHHHAPGGRPTARAGAPRGVVRNSKALSVAKTLKRVLLYV